MCRKGKLLMVTTLAVTAGLGVAASMAIPDAVQAAAFVTPPAAFDGMAARFGEDTARFVAVQLEHERGATRS